MKSLFPYLVLAILFLAGTRLVNRQQNYTQSLKESATTFSSLIAANKPQMHPLQTRATSLTDALSNQHKPSSSEPKKGKKRVQ